MLEKGLTLKQSSTQQPLVFFMYSETNFATDPVGITGGAPTVTICKEGSTSFASPAGAVTEIGNGWYQVAGNATDTNTLGRLLLKATLASAVDSYYEYQVTAFDPNSMSSLVQAIWDALTAALTTANSIGKKLADWAATLGADNRVKLTSDSHTSGVVVADVTAALTVDSITDKTGYALSTAGKEAVADQVWDEATSGHATAGTFGKAITDIADPWNVTLPGAYASGKAGYILGTNLDVVLSTRSSLSIANVTTGVNNALDAASTELASVPTTTGSIRQAIQFLFAYFRNKRTVTSSVETLFKEDAATTLGTSAVSNNGTTFSKGEMNT